MYPKYQSMRVPDTQAVRTESVITDSCYNGARSAATQYFNTSIGANVLQDLTLGRSANGFDSEFASTHTHTLSQEKNHHNESSLDRIYRALVPLGALLAGWLQSCSERFGKRNDSSRFRKRTYALPLLGGKRIERSAARHTPPKTHPSQSKRFAGRLSKPPG